MEYFEGMGVGGGRPNPVTEPRGAEYMVFNTPTYKDLAMTVGRKET